MGQQNTKDYSIQEQEWHKKVTYASVAYVTSLAGNDDDMTADLLTILIRTILNERPVSRKSLFYGNEKKNK